MCPDKVSGKTETITWSDQKNVSAQIKLHRTKQKRTFHYSRREDKATMRRFELKLLDAQMHVYGTRKNTTEGRGK